MVRAVCTLGFWALLLVGSSVAAQAASPKATLSPNDEVARGLFQAGKAAYEAGSYDEALDLFEQAHARSGRPGLLFNIGQVADRLRQDEKALSAFRSYLEQVPDAENRAEVESRIAALERAEAQRKAVAAAAPAPTAAPTAAQAAQQAQTTSAAEDPALTQGEEPAADKPVTKQWWFWTGLGAVVVGGTAVALALALGGDAGTQAPYQGSAGSLKGP
jgi:tetratricopeptide (TPR) repeat protein